MQILKVLLLVIVGTSLASGFFFKKKKKVYVHQPPAVHPQYATGYNYHHYYQPAPHYNYDTHPAPVAAPAPAPIPVAYAPAPAPAPIPVAYPAQAPVYAPVYAPVHAPVSAPVHAPVQTPVHAPVHAPVQQAPVSAPVHAPVQAPVHAPVHVPARAPAHPPVHAPVHAPVQAPMHAPAPAQVFAPVQAPVPPPAQTPAVRPGPEPTPSIPLYSNQALPAFEAARFDAPKTNSFEIVPSLGFQMGTKTDVIEVQKSEGKYIELPAEFVRVDDVGVARSLPVAVEAEPEPVARIEATPPVLQSNVLPQSSFETFAPLPEPKSTGLLDVAFPEPASRANVIEVQKSNSESFDLPAQIVSTVGTADAAPAVNGNDNNIQVLASKGESIDLPVQIVTNDETENSPPAVNGGLTPKGDFTDFVVQADANDGTVGSALDVVELPASSQDAGDVGSVLLNPGDPVPLVSNNDQSVLLDGLAETADTLESNTDVPDQQLLNVPSETSSDDATSKPIILDAVSATGDTVVLQDDANVQPTLEVLSRTVEDTPVSNGDGSSKSILLSGDQRPAARNRVAAEVTPKRLSEDVVAYRLRSEDSDALSFPEVQEVLRELLQQDNFDEKRLKKDIASSLAAYSRKGVQIDPKTGYSRVVRQ